MIYIVQECYIQNIGVTYQCASLGCAESDRAPIVVVVLCDLSWILFQFAHLCKRPLRQDYLTSRECLLEICGICETLRVS